MNNIHNTLEAKVVILGKTGVGKTSVAVRYVQNTFSPNSTSTIGASFMTKKLSIDDYSIRLQIWDTAGQERFRAMAPMYYRGASAAILVYDITSEESFTELISWMEELNKNMTDELVIHVVGNKIDLESKRKVSVSTVEDFCDGLSTPVSGIHEVSAKDNYGIDDIFFEISQALLKNRFGQDIYRTVTSSDNNLGSDSGNSAEKSSGCCT